MYHIIKKITIGPVVYILRPKKLQRTFSQIEPTLLNIKLIDSLKDEGRQNDLY